MSESLIKQITAAEFGADEQYDIMARAKALISAAPPIPVSERLPEFSENYDGDYSEDVLCWNAGSGVWTVGTYWKELDGVSNDGWMCDHGWPYRVTHWLPLPPAPNSP